MSPDRAFDLKRISCIIAVSITKDDSTEDYAFRRTLSAHIDKMLRQTPITNVNYASYFALVYEEGGQWQKAIELELQVMGARRLSLGEEHPHMLTSMGNLALSFLKQGQWEDAERLQTPSAKAPNTPER
jgi:hypothetical protein